MYNQRQIRLLDCTLRDGGHLNEGIFGKEVIKNVIKKLAEANVDIIEAGFYGIVIVMRIQQDIIQLQM